MLVEGVTDANVINDVDRASLLEATRLPKRESPWLVFVERYSGCTIRISDGMATLIILGYFGVNNRPQGHYAREAVVQGCWSRIQDTGRSYQRHLYWLVLSGRIEYGERH